MTRPLLEVRSVEDTGSAAVVARGVGVVAPEEEDDSAPGPFCSPPPGGADMIAVVIHTIDPRGTSLVEMKLGWLASKGKPAVPVPSAFLNGVQVMLSMGTLALPMR